MDYYPHLTETCPSGYAEEAQQSDLTKFTMDFVLDRAQTEWRTVSAECRNALVAYFAKDIGPQTEINNLRSWLRGIADYAGDMPSDLKADIREAILRIPFQENLASTYFSALRRQNIDIRDELAQRIETDPAYASLATGSGSDAWHYTVYLAAMQTPGAYDRLDRMVAGMTDSGDVYGAIVSLQERLGTPQARQIAEQYADDPRILYGPSNKGSPLGKIVRVILQFWPPSPH